MFKLLFKNPETIRNFRSKLRLKTLLVAFVILLAIMIFIGVLALGAAESSSPLKRMESWHTLFMIYAGLVLLLGYIYGPASAATSIVGEKEKKTYDFLFLTPLSDITLTVGKLIGTTALAWFILLVILPFLQLAGIMGSVHVLSQFLFCLVLVTGTLCFASLGLLISADVTKAANATAGAVGLVFAIVTVSSIFMEVEGARFLAILSPIPLLREIGEEVYAAPFRVGYYREPYEFNVSFFGVMLKGGVLTILAYLYLTFWAVIAAARKIRNPLGTYLSKGQAIIFFVLFEVFMIGAAWSYMGVPASADPPANFFIQDGFIGALVAFSFTQVLMLFAFAHGLSLSYDDYFAYVRARIEKRPYGFFHPRTPSFLVFVSFILLLVVGFLIAVRFYGSVPVAVKLHLAVAVQIALIFYLVLQLFKTMFKEYALVVTALLLIVTNIIPPIVVGVFKLPEKFFYYLCPVPYLVQILQPYSREITDFYVLPVLLGGFLLLFSGLLLWRHHTIKKILTRRAEV